MIHRRVQHGVRAQLLKDLAPRLTVSPTSAAFSHCCKRRSKSVLICTTDTGEALWYEMQTKPYSGHPDLGNGKLNVLMLEHGKKLPKLRHVV